jgi:hypothetical protein
MVKTFFGAEPLYLLKWNSVKPVGFQVTEKYGTYRDDKGNEINIVTKDLEPIDPKFDDKTNILPELLRTTFESRYLRSMKKYAEGGGGLGRGFVFILIAVLLVGLVYYAVASGMLKL